jgi:hypothetical protein
MAEGQGPQRSHGHTPDHPQRRPRGRSENTRAEATGSDGTRPDGRWIEGRWIEGGQPEGTSEADRLRRRTLFLRERSEARALRERVQPRRARSARLRQSMRMRTFRW